MEFKMNRTLILLLALAFAGSSVRAETCSTLTVGIITDLSGPARNWGHSIQNGFEFGLEDSGCKTLKVLYEDDQMHSPKTVTAFKKLTEHDNVDAVVVSSSSAGNTVAPLAEQKGIPLFAWASDTRVSRGRQFVVRTWASADDEGHRLAEIILKDGVKDLAFIRATHDYSDSIFKAFSEVYPKEKLILSEEFPPENQDFKPFLMKAKAAGVQLIGACLVSSGFSGLLAKQMRDLGLTAKLFGCQTFEFSGEFAASDGALAGTVYNASSVKPEFLARYSKRFGTPGTAGGAAMHYDLARILAKTSARGKALIDELSTIKIEAQAIRRVEFKRKNGDQFLDVPIAIHRFRNDGTTEEISVE
jgi:ABC-type branched-subunit amino acid transport system substrate-binding protein